MSIFYEIEFAKYILPYRKRTLSESRTSKPDTQGQKPVVDTSVEHVQELEDENLKLRIENAFLKELRRLRLEDKQKQRVSKIIYQSRKSFKLNDLLSYTQMQGNLCTGRNGLTVRIPIKN